MDSIPYASIIILGSLLFFSAYFSASETAITSVNKIRLRSQAEGNNGKANRALKLAEQFDQSLSTILIGNNIVNIAMASIATKIATDMFGSQGSTLVLSTAIVTVLVLIFGEILPKSLAKQYSEKYLISISASLTLIMKLFYPVTLIFVKLKEYLNKIIGSKQEEPSVTEEDVKAMIEIGEEEGTFLTDEKELVNSALDFNDIVVNDIITPRADVIAVSIKASNDEIKDTFIREKYSRLPVYDGSIDNIVGTISHRDFFEYFVNDTKFDFQQIIRKPFFVIGSMKVSNLLKELQKNKVHLAIVLDEYGGTEGIISIEDILEEIVGDIWDEHDESESMIEKISEDTYCINGKISVEQFSDTLNIQIGETDSNTLSGWVSETFGYLPKPGDVLKYDKYDLLIKEVNKRRIQKIIVKMQKEEMQTA